MIEQDDNVGASLDAILAECAPAVVRPTAAYGHAEHQPWFRRVVDQLDAELERP